MMPPATALLPMLAAASILLLSLSTTHAQPEYRVPAPWAPWIDHLAFDTEASRSLCCMYVAPRASTDGPDEPARAFTQPHSSRPSSAANPRLPICAWAGKLAPSDLTQIAPEPNSISQMCVMCT